MVESAAKVPDVSGSYRAWSNIMSKHAAKRLWASLTMLRGIACGALLGSLLTGCAFLQPPIIDPTPLEAGQLPVPDMTLQLPQLGPCTDALDQAVSLDSSKPVTVLVHG